MLPCERSPKFVDDFYEVLEHIKKWIAPKIVDSVKGIRELRDAETEVELLARMERKRGANVVP